ncbi:MAG: hypothetical protein FJ344_02830 [Sphingomonadales bacterium]|nr:hypothetical protein [Sphingomonadales bacterium]
MPEEPQSNPSSAQKPPEQRIKINKNIAISESGFIFNPGTGNSFSTIPNGLRPSISSMSTL